jgi:hypothetical protein
MMNESRFIKKLISEKTLSQSFYSFYSRLFIRPRGFERGFFWRCLIWRLMTLIVIDVETTDGYVETLRIFKASEDMYKIPSTSARKGSI